MSTTWIPRTDSLGARLALIRQAKHWNMREAALACSIDPASWRGWENGAMPRDLVSAASKISAATGVDHWWLMTGLDDHRHGLPAAPHKLCNSGALRDLRFTVRPRLALVAS